MATKKKPVVDAPSQPEAEWVPIDSVKPWPRNPKVAPDDIEPWVTSLKTFGWASPLLVRRESGVLIGGHATLAAARELGEKRVLVRFLDLTERRAEQLAIAVSQLERLRKWDEAELGKLLAEFRDDDEDNGVLGFDDEQLARLLGENYESKVEEIDVTSRTAVFYLSATGPLPKQADFLERLKKALAGVEGVDVDVTVTEL